MAAKFCSVVTEETWGAPVETCKRAFTDNEKLQDQMQSVHGRERNSFFQRMRYDALDQPLSSSEMLFAPHQENLHAVFGAGFLFLFVTQGFDRI